jgi:hypothetical protein
LFVDCCFGCVLMLEKIIFIIIIIIGRLVQQFEVVLDVCGFIVLLKIFHLCIHDLNDFSCIVKGFSLTTWTTTRFSKIFDFQGRWVVFFCREAPVSRIKPGKKSSSHVKWASVLFSRSTRRNTWVRNFTAAKNLHEFSRFSDPEKDFGEGRFATFSFFVDIFRCTHFDLRVEVVWLWTRDALVQYFGSVKKHDNWKA